MKVTWRIPLALLLVIPNSCGDGTSEPQTNSVDGSMEPGDGSFGGSAGQRSGGAAGSGGMASAGTGGMPSTGAGGLEASAGAGGQSGAVRGSAGAGGMGSPGVRIVGRTAMGAGTSAVQFAWPGVNIHASFTGTQASMMVNDATGNNRVTVVIDGGAPKTFSLASGQSTVSLASGLATGVHEIVVWRNTEASPGGLTTFSGFTGLSSGGALLAPPPVPARRIEVVGDSLSVGAGVEGNATCTGGIDAHTNNYLAYGSLAARAVSADIVTIAYSGIGVYRNYGEATPTASSLTMPRRYPYAVPDTVLWDFSLYQPQVVVINLGTNDFGSGDPGVLFENAYVSFVQSVRGKYADAYFILIDMYGGMRLTRLNNILATLKTGGESKVEVLSLNSVQNNLGCNQHPNVAGQQGMGNTLAARLRVVMGW